MNTPQIPGMDHLIGNMRDAPEWPAKYDSIDKSVVYVGTGNICSVTAVHPSASNVVQYILPK